MNAEQLTIENIKLRDRVAELERLLSQAQAMEQLQALKLERMAAQQPRR